MPTATGFKQTKGITNLEIVKAVIRWILKSVNADAQIIQALT